ncbi:spinster family MFS transporter [Solimonas marina]|uniref:MFS transporter n=1 Tax=Solimonas marina TaxID=2714601 RepID=A0A969WBM9_9GAMM|nr:MFS transporter [Solimonas marina]NKF23564.1 MFS transporter [Solimonas marina]
MSSMNEHHDGAFAPTPQPMDSIASPSASASANIPRYSWWVLAILVGVYSCCWTDRYLMVILIEPIAKDLHLNDAQMGLLTGFAFTLVYSFAGLPFAYWADRKSRKLVLSIAVFGWSIATMLSSLGRNFVTMAMARLGVATFEAGCSPPAYSLISDYFPASHRARAIAIYGLGISFGIWAGLTLGGAVNAHYGWRAAFIVLGLPSLVMATLVLLFVREPRRGQHERTVDRRYSAAQAARLMAVRPSFIGSAFAMALLTITSTSFVTWAPTYLIRARGLDTEQVGFIIGSISGFSGIAGSLAMGWLCDRLAGRDPRWYLWLPLIGFALFLPFERLFFMTTGTWSYVFYFLASMASSTYIAPLFSVGQLVLPARVRALGAAVMLMVLNLLGMGFGSYAVGLLSDHFKPTLGDESLRAAAMWLQISALLGFVCLAVAARSIRRDVEMTERSVSA